MRETKRISKKAASRRREHDSDVNGEDYDWDNALVASDSASDCPDRPSTSKGLNSFLEKSSQNLADGTSVSSASRSEDSVSYSTCDSDRAKPVPVQLMRIAEEPDDEIIFERSLHSPKGRQFPDAVTIVSPNDAVFKPDSPAKCLSRFPFEDLNLGEGNSRSSYQGDDDNTEQATEIAGNLTSMKEYREPEEFQELFDGLKESESELNLDVFVGLKESMTETESEPKDNGIFGGLGESTAQETLIQQSAKDRRSTDFPAEQNGSPLSPRMMVEKVEKKSYKHRELTVPVGSADSTAPLESFDHSEARKEGFPTWIVVTFFTFALAALITAIVFIAVSRMAIVDESVDEPLSEYPGGHTAKSMQEIAFSVSGPLPLDESNSPQSKALRWLTTVDNGVTTQSREMMAERYIVAALYFATGGEAWIVQHNFLSQGSVCEWNEVNSSKEVRQGIVCDDNLKVKHIVLAGNSLGGTIPSEIALLESLETLDLSRNYIQGEIPMSLGQLSNLKEMDLNSNLIKGQIPSIVGSLAGLLSLDLSSNRLTGGLPSQIGRLENLEHLSLGNNMLEGSIPESLTKMKSLVELNIFRNEFSGTIPKTISELPNLMSLNFASNRFFGDIGEAFCSSGQEYEAFWADCRGDDPMVDCSCCTICCEQNGDALVC